MGKYDSFLQAVKAAEIPQVTPTPTPGKYADFMKASEAVSKAQGFHPLGRVGLGLESVMEATGLPQGVRVVSGEGTMADKIGAALGLGGLAATGIQGLPIVSRGTISPLLKYLAGVFGAGAGRAIIGPETERLASSIEAESPKAAFAARMVPEVAGSIAIPSLIGKMFGPLATRAIGIKPTPGGQRMLSELERGGADVTLGERLGASGRAQTPIQRFETSLADLPLTAERVEKMKGKQAEVLTEAMKREMRAQTGPLTFTQGTAQRGEALKDAVGGLKTRASAQYQKAREALEGIKPKKGDAGDIGKQAVMDVLAEKGWTLRQGKLIPSAARPELTKEEAVAILKLQGEFNNARTGKTLQTYGETLKSLDVVKRKLGGYLPPDQRDFADAIHADIVRRVNTGVEESAKKVNKNIGARFGAARQRYGEMVHGTIDEILGARQKKTGMKGLAESVIDTEKGVQNILKGGVNTITSLKKTLTPKEFTELSQAAAERAFNLFAQQTDAGTVVNANSLNLLLKGEKGITPESLKMLFGEGGLKALSDLKDRMMMLGRTEMTIANPSGTAKRLVGTSFSLPSIAKGVAGRTYLDLQRGGSPSLRALAGTPAALGMEEKRKRELGEAR